MPPALPKHHHRAVFYTAPGGESLPFDYKGVGYTKCLHKRPWEESRYMIPNEIICYEIGRMIGLPIPPCAVSYSPDGTKWFSSLHFNFDEDELPPVIPDLFWNAQPDGMTGLIVFDIFVMNSDRHDKNLVVDNQAHPTSFNVIDHDQALFGGNGILTIGEARLKENKDTLGISQGNGGSRNDFIGEMKESKFVSKWIKRIKDLKNWMIDQSVEAGAKYGLNSDEKSAVKAFLKDRRDRLDDIIIRNKDYFVSVEVMNVMGRFL